MVSLVEEAYPHDEFPYPQLAKGHYDFLGPSGDVLLPGIWESSVGPGGKVTLRLWPLNGFGNPETSPWELAEPATASRKGYKTTAPFSKSDSKPLDDVGSRSLATSRVCHPSSPLTPPIQSPPPSEPVSKRNRWSVQKSRSSSKLEHNTDNFNLSSDNEGPENRRPRTKWKDRILGTFRAGRSSPDQI